MKFAIVVLLAMSPLLSRAAPGTCSVTTHQFAAYMALDFWTFDQTDKGWREVAEKQGCDFAGAQIIDAYILEHWNQLQPWENQLAFFHAGQSYAFEEPALYTVAVSRFKKAFNPTEDQYTTPHLKWNAYVAATIAFLKKDIEALKTSRQEMASGVQTPGNSTNLKIVDGFIKCFDKTYRQVYMGEFGCRSMR